MDIPVRRADEEPLQELFKLVKSELNLDGKNARQEQAKFWKQHPALVKVKLIGDLTMITEAFCICHESLVAKFNSLPFFRQRC